jgi:hypothetical protein
MESSGSLGVAAIDAEIARLRARIQELERLKTS